MGGTMRLGTKVTNLL